MIFERIEAIGMDIWNPNMVQAYLKAILGRHSIPEACVNDFTITATHTGDWISNDTTFDVSYKGSTVCFTIYENEDYETEFYKRLDNAVMDLIVHRTIVPINSEIRTAKRRLPTINSRFRPKLHYRPSWY